MNAFWWEDFYKIGHINQYPKGIKKVYVNWTPRSSRVEGQNKVVYFGGQYLIKQILMKEWQLTFFGQPLNHIIQDYKDFIAATLGDKNPRTDHIVALHRLGYLPIKIYSVPEGESVPLRVPMMVIVNTDDRFFWLPNFLETIISNILWKPCTSATTAQRYRALFMKYARLAGETDFGFVDWQGHDFSMRGMSGREDAILSGMGHLTSFSGTDTIPAIFAAKEFYNAEYSIGGSVPATEHSVMCAGGCENEQETFRRLIEDVYPNGIVSVVSDTWDLWKVLTQIVPNLKDKILARDGKVVIRPDSGDPVKIMVGDPDYSKPDNVRQGVLRLLAKAVGTTKGSGRYPLLNKMGAIYGDSITLERAEQILHGMVINIQLSPYNMVFGIGSFTYEYTTRDTFGFAMKATAIEDASGKTVAIFKKPVTDDGMKNSLKGIPAVFKTVDGSYSVVETDRPELLDACDFQKVFEDGRLLVDEKFSSIRERVRRDL